MRGTIASPKCGGFRGGAGGGGSSSPAAPPETPATPTVTPATPATPPTVAQPSPVAQMVSPVFNRSLALGMRHPDVKRLQQVLNSDPDTQIASTGPGSPGNETEFFGPATVKAVKRFQAKHDLEPVGIVGPKTRSALSESAVSVPATPSPSAQPSPVAQIVSPAFNKSLSKGMRNTDVKRLQQLLNSDPDTQIASSGAGSLGNETELFGPATEKAVMKFQKKYGLEPVGTVGPKTRSQLNEIFGSTGSTPAPVAPAQSQPSTTNETQKLLDQLKVLQDQLNALKQQ